MAIYNNLTILNIDKAATYRVSQKKCDLRLNAPRGLQKGATDKSWVSFGKLGNFQFNEHRNFVFLHTNAWDIKKKIAFEQHNQLS